MKKFKIMIVSLLIMLSIVSCTSGKSSSKVGGESEFERIITISVWTYYNGAAKDTFYKLVDEFNATVGKENNIIVEPRTTASVDKLADSVIASANKDIGAEPMPHIFMAYPDSTFKIDQMGLVLDLDSYFTAEELGAYRKDFLEEGYFGTDNALKIIPIAKSSEILYINKTDFELFTSEVNIDVSLLETWEGIAIISEQYYNWTDSKTEQFNDGKAFFGIDSMANFIIVGAEQLGNTVCSVTDNDVEVTITRETAQKIWDNFYVPFVSGYYASIGNFRSDDAKTGEILAYTGSTAGASWFPKQIETGKDETYPIEAMTFPIPVFEGGTKVAVHQGAGLVVTKSDEKHQDAAIIFLKWFTEAKQNAIFALQTGYIPVKTELLNMKSFESTSKEYLVTDIDPVVALAAQTIYTMLDTYDMYANKPYSTSYETRKILENSLETFAKKDLEKINEEVKTDTKENVLISYIGNENFEKWFDSFILELEQTIPK